MSQLPWEATKRECAGPIHIEGEDTSMYLQIHAQNTHTQIHTQIHTHKYTHTPTHTHTQALINMEGKTFSFAAGATRPWPRIAINDTEPVGMRWVDNHPFPGLPDDWDEPFPETSGDD